MGCFFFNVIFGPNYQIKRSQSWCCTPLIPALGRERKAGFWVLGQPGLQIDGSQGYPEKFCLEKPKQNKQKTSRGQSNAQRLWAFDDALSENPGSWFPAPILWLGTIIPVPGDPMPSSGFYGHQAHPQSTSLIQHLGGRGSQISVSSRPAKIT